MNKEIFKLSNFSPEVPALLAEKCLILDAMPQPESTTDYAESTD
jgi:hypothetical protein